MYSRPNSNHPGKIAKQSGLALVTVLLIVAIIGTLQVLLMEQQHLLVRRITNQNAAEQSYQYAQGVTAWGARVLFEDVDRGVDYLDEKWAKFGKPPEVNNEEGGSFSLTTTSQREAQEEEPEVIDFGFEGLEYEIVDLQARYNLNNLADPNPTYRNGQRRVFINLLELLEIGEFDTREQLFGALVDWMDENDLISANGTESGEYQIKNTPYYAADQKMTTLGELRFVEGFTEEIITVLKPHVAVLPITNARLNINTASAEVIASLAGSPVTELSSIQAFLADRENEAFLGFRTGSDLERAKTAIIGATAVRSQPTPNMLQTNSQFFQINTQVTLGDYLYCMRTLVLRQTGGQASASAPGVSILRREHDTFCSEEAA